MTAPATTAGKPSETTLRGRPLTDALAGFGQTK